MNRNLIIEASKGINRIDIYPIEQQIQSMANPTLDTMSNFSKVTESVNKIINIDYLESSLEAVKLQTKVMSSVSKSVRNYYEAIYVDNFRAIQDLDIITSNMQFNLASTMPTINEFYSQITIFDYVIISQQIPTKIAELAYNISDNMASMLASYQMHEQIIIESEDYYYDQFTIKLEQEDNKVLFILKKIYETRDVNLIRYIDSYQMLLSLRYILLRYETMLIFMMAFILFHIKKKFIKIEVYIEVYLELFGSKGIHKALIKKIDNKLEDMENQKLIED